VCSLCVSSHQVHEADHVHHLRAPELGVVAVGVSGPALAGVSGENRERGQAEAPWPRPSPPAQSRISPVAAAEASDPGRKSGGDHHRSRPRDGDGGARARAPVDTAELARAEPDLACGACTDPEGIREERGADERRVRARRGAGACTES